MLPLKKTNKEKRKKTKAFGKLWSADLQHPSGHFILIVSLLSLLLQSRALADESENQAMSSARFIHYSHSHPE